MRNFTILAGLLLTGSSFASGAVPLMAGNESGKATLQLQTAPVKLESLTNAKPSKEAEAGSIITEAPAGTTLNYSRDALGYNLVYGIYLMFSEQLDQAGQLVDGDDGFVYIKNPISGLTYNSYLKGVREGDKIRVDLPQVLYQENSTTEEGVVIDFYARILEAQIDDEGNRYFVPSENQTLYYTVTDNEVSLDLGYVAEKGEDGTYPYPDKVLGLSTEDGQWAYYSDCWQKWTKVNLELQTMPGALLTEKWAFFHNGIVDYADVAFDDNYMYVINFYEQMPDAVLKGKIEGDTVVFDSGAYLGNYVSYYIYQQMCYMNEGEPELKDSITLTYDKENKVIAATDPNDIILLNTSLNRVYALTNFQNPKFVLPRPVTNPVPMTPKFNDFLNYYDTYGYAYIVFDIFNYNEEEEVFNPVNMWYHLILDGVVETIVPEDYIRVPEAMTDIPFNFKDSYDIHIDGSKRTVCIYAQGITTAGIQLFHEYEGNVYESGVMTYDVDTGEVNVKADEIKAVREIKSTEWYNLQGQRVANPEKGLYICKYNYADGSSKSVKIARR